MKRLLGLLASLMLGYGTSAGAADSNATTMAEKTADENTIGDGTPKDSAAIDEGSDAQPANKKTAAKKNKNKGHHKGHHKDHHKDKSHKTDHGSTVGIPDERQPASVGDEADREAARD